MFIIVEKLNVISCSKLISYFTKSLKNYAIINISLLITKCIINFVWILCVSVYLKIVYF